MDSKNLAIMFTDLKGFTQKTSSHSRKQIDYLLDLQDSIVRPIIKNNGGVIVKTIGDAYMATFESPTNAVLCGMKIQEGLVTHNATAPSVEHLVMRIAINSGEVNIKDGDIFGEPVNVAARIEAIAEPGEVYFTESVYLSMNKNEIPTADVGYRHLKGIPEEVKVYKVIREQSELLKKKMMRAENAILNGDLDKHVPHLNDQKNGISKNTHSSYLLFSGNKWIVVIALVGVIIAGILIFNKGIDNSKNYKDISSKNSETLKDTSKNERVENIRGHLTSKEEEQLKAKIEDEKRILEEKARESAR